MHRLASILFLIGLSTALFSQNPHGDEMQINCAACHSPAGWEISQEYWKEIELVKPTKSKMTGMPLPVDTSLFHHNKTDFLLEGQHASIDCRSCHESLVFAEAQTDCISCHVDLHQMTVGADCARCHNPENWLVDNITELHQENGFPLLGAHATASCFDCHTSESALRFDRIGNDCINCHLDEFRATTNPDHGAAGFSTICIECHQIENPDWGTEVVDHSFFPLTKGHEVNECAACHAGGDFANTPNDCFACHQMDFEATTGPDHQLANFVTDCAACHTTDVGWMPAEYLAHDTEHFPIYSGSHAGEWDQCVDCHTNPANFEEFTCVTCHENPETDDAHVGENGYSYNSSACLSCHQTGETDYIFDHNLMTTFPLTGVHLTTECTKCHSAGYEGTPTDCAACHQMDFDGTFNPNHNALGLSTDCASCHTTEPDWQPAAFANHNDYYALNGAHAAIANDCAECHSGDYNNTPTDCVGCHQMHFDGTLNPNHNTLGLSTDCISCHTTEPDWQPAAFANHNDYFALNGAHAAIASDCAACHSGDYNNTPNTCVGCHQGDYDQSTDPDHVAIGLSTNCTNCHSEDDWASTTFVEHDLLFFPIYSGVHEGEWSECIECHINPGNYAEFTCVTCHANPETDEAHVSVGGYVYESTTCLACHPTGDATNIFGHTTFPLTGAHITTDCIDCHSAGYAGTPTECVACHQGNFDGSTNPNHNALGLSTDCISCHTTEPDWQPAAFANHNDHYALNGAHADIANDCAACHNGNYNNTPTDCVGCHQTDFDLSTNPNHPNLNIPTDCATCHTTDPGWESADFPIHDDYYVLNGAHALIANDCATCHNGDYNNTPNTCYGCHQAEYDNTANPNHATVQFSTDCISCHGETEWVPATFDHDAQYFPIYSGAHNGEWGECIDCHTNPNNYAEFSCTVCHVNPETDNAHVSIGGYSYNSPSCFACHPTGSADDNFDHNNTNFPLTGAHTTTDCIDCHANGYQGTPTDCAACHQMDFDQTTNPDHDAIGISTDCESCHTTDPGWEPATFAIHNNYWVLDGEHTNVNDCAECHNGNYNNTPNTCVGCHQANYDQSTNPSHTALNIPTDCATCHTTEPDWMPATFAIHDNYYMLNGAHALIANDCAACHNGNYNNTPNTCYGCHQTDYESTTNPDHEAAQFPTDCLECHSEDGWTPSTFDHETIYPLTGAHAAIENDCALCHVNGNYNNTPNTCVGCHQTDFNQTNNPNHTALNIPTDCATCHTTEPDWMPATFAIHDNYYMLNGAHAIIANDCAACHNGDYNDTPNTCYGCHQTDYENTTNPDHEALQFSTDCMDCHTESAWSPANFDHNVYYPLTGAHETIANDCNLCHTNGNYNNTPNTCVGCHQPDYDQSTNPNHAALAIPTDCETCHTTDPGWEPATFAIHNNYWVLDGAHVDVADDCVGCHNGDYNNTPNSCVGCHQPDYDQSTNPNHVALAIPTDCETCHTTDPGWEPAAFAIHNNYWVLDGAHVDVADDCVICHNGDYNNTPNTCVGCHQPDYDQSTNPNHVALAIPTDCETCHTTDPGWEPATFPIHDNYWVLDGAHLDVADDCVECHNGDYNNTPNTCIGCHQPDYDQSTNPNHQALNIPTDCAMCHTTDPDWMPATFPIHDDYYMLNGAHAIIANDCAICHNGNYNNTPNTCFGCHESDYNNTTNPNHMAAQFPTDCQDCHSEDAWIPSTFDHNGFYPLTGAHLAIENDCILCHVGGNYNNTPNDCVGCHQPDYDQSTNPNHVALAIPNDCAMCHTTDPDWVPATFPIHDNYYQLNGAHVAIQNDCAACHNGNYNITPNTCFGCHESDYNNANNPDHAAAGFPTDCELCHTESAWVPANFNHDNMYFPIYDGKHEGEWDLCVDCHIGGNYGSFSCIDCHEHEDPVELAEKHEDVSTYSYSSPACYSCHPDGEK